MSDGARTVLGSQQPLLGNQGGFYTAHVFATHALRAEDVSRSVREFLNLMKLDC